MTKAQAMADVLDRAAAALLDLAHELRALAAHPGCADEDRPQAQIAARLNTFWDGVSLSPLLEMGAARIDLLESQGRWELLVLAVLRAARVNEEVALATFAALKEAGLLELARLVEGSESLRSQVVAVLERHYKALGNRESKVDALFWNARHLTQAWDGDLNNLYDPEAELVLARLHEFKQVGRIAHWICRTMKVHGLWLSLESAAYRYFDRYVRLPVERLFYGGRSGMPDSHSRLAEEVEEITDKYFGGDVLPLYMHGQSLCAQNSPDVCLAECPVAAWCSFPAGETGLGRNVLRDVQ